MFHLAKTNISQLVKKNLVTFVRTKLPASTVINNKLVPYILISIIWHFRKTYIQLNSKKFFLLFSSRFSLLMTVKPQFPCSSYGFYLKRPLILLIWTTNIILSITIGHHTRTQPCSLTIAQGALRVKEQMSKLGGSVLSA